MVRACTVIVLWSLLAATPGLRAVPRQAGENPPPTPASAPGTQGNSQPSLPVQAGLPAQASPSTSLKLPQVPVAGDPFFAPLAASRKPQTLRDKLNDYLIRTVGPRALTGPALSAAIEMARPPAGYPHAWRDGADGCGRLYGSALARSASLQTGRFLTGALVHEDFRYRPSASKNPLARSLHALAFTFVDKSDSGSSRPALANFAGAAAGGFVGESYLPRGYNNARHAQAASARLFGNLAGQNLLREFSPDIKKVTSRFHVPFPRIPVAPWWTRGGSAVR